MTRSARLTLTPLFAAVSLALTLTACGGTAQPGPSARDLRWQADIADLANTLPRVRVGALDGVSERTWHAAAARLEAEVPRLSDGQIIVGMARMVALLHDDETMIQIPAERFYPLDTWVIGDRLYLTGVPAADGGILGSQLLAVGGHPITDVMNAIGSMVDYEDPGMLPYWESAYVTYADVLYWLGFTPTATSAAITVRTPAGAERTVQITATTKQPNLALIPLPLYLQSEAPYWLKVLPGQDAVYLRYSKCLDTSGFQQLAARALAIMAHHPAYRLIVDLRENPGGTTSPFQALIKGITANPVINRRDRIFGLVDAGTDSSATNDAQTLKTATNAILIGTAPADPLDTYGNSLTFRLPRSGIIVQYTTKIVNKTGHDWGMPQITIAPTPAQFLDGADPVLAAALTYHS